MNRQVLYISEGMNGMLSGGSNVMNREAFFTKNGSDMIGVYLTGDGPKLFINSEVFELQNNCWDVEMVMGKSSHLVTFYWNGEVKLSIRCGNENDMFLSLYHYLSCRPEVQRLA